MALKYGDGVMCTSQEQWDRITATLKGMGLKVYHDTGTSFQSWPRIGWAEDGVNNISYWRGNGGVWKDTPESDFLAACKEEAIKLGVYKEDWLEEGDVCLVVGPDCNGGMSFKGETVTVVNDYGPNCFDLSQRVEARTKWGPIWLPITSLQKITTPEDDEIRVGDIVTTSANCHDPYPAWKVLSVDRGRGTADVKIVVNALGRSMQDGTVYPGKELRILKKLKAGGPVSTKQTTNQHGQVQGTSDKDSAGAGGRTAQRPDAGRQGATGGRHQGQRASRPASRWRGAKGPLRFTI